MRLWRLVVVALAAAVASCASASSRTLVGESGTVFIESRTVREWKFPAVSDADGRITLEFLHRIDYPKAVGWCRALQVEVNGEPVVAAGTRRQTRLLNKPYSMSHRHHGEYTADNKSDKWYSMYLPDFHAADGFFKPATPEASRLVLDITDKTRTDGENTVTIRCFVPAALYSGDKAQGRRRAMAIGGLTVRAEPGVAHLPRVVSRSLRPTMEARPVVAYDVGGDDEKLVVKTGGCDTPVLSRFSVPNGGMVQIGNKASVDTPFYSVRRRIVREADRIDVFDTFTSKTNALIGVRIRHEMPVGSFDPIYVAGDSSPSAKEFDGGRNPSVFAADSSGRFGIALIAQDDVFRVQNRQYCDDDFTGIRTDGLALLPGEPRTVEWSIYPTATADYYEFVNAVRRDWGVNFRIDGGFTFGFAEYGNGSPEGLRRRRRNEGLVWQSMPAHFWRHVDGDPKYRDYVGNIWGMGRNSPFVRVKNGSGEVVLEDPKVMDAFEEKCLRRCREINPGLKAFFYIHNQISVGSDDGKYEDFALYNADGSRRYYGSVKHNKLFVPTLGNAFGRDFLKLVDWVCDRFDIDGIYQDECSYCNTRVYGGTNMWDGATVELDDLGNVKRKLSFVPLLKLPLTLKTFDRIINGKKKLMVANFSPETRSERQYHFPRFEETVLARWIALSHLYTPIQLGDMLTYSSSAKDMAADQRIALKRGALYYHYAGNTGCPSLTSKMYPFTPVELHSGWLVGEERILTCVSGEFGWRGERPDVDVFVFDELGREVKGYPCETKETQLGRVFVLELKPDYCAAIVRKSALKSGVTLELSEGAVVYASTNHADYAHMPRGERTFVSAIDATNAAICGKGVLDGRGWAFRESRRLPGWRWRSSTAGSGVR